MLSPSAHAEVTSVIPTGCSPVHLVVMKNKCSSPQAKGLTEELLLSASEHSDSASEDGTADLGPSRADSVGGGSDAKLDPAVSFNNAASDADMGAALSPLTASHLSTETVKAAPAGEMRGFAWPRLP